MTAVRALAALFALLVLVGAGESPALARDGSEDTPTGTLIIPARGSASMPIAGAEPGDTIQWIWTVAPPSSEALATQLVWSDSAGREHIVSPDRPGQTFGTFGAPKDFLGGRLIWRNTGEVAVDVQWAYGVSAPFWRRPGMFLPASIPLLLLVAAYVLGKAFDARARRRGGGRVDGRAVELELHIQG